MVHNEQKISAVQIVSKLLRYKNVQGSFFNLWKFNSDLLREYEAYAMCFFSEPIKHTWSN